MKDRAIIALAIATWSGAFLAISVPNYFLLAAALLLLVWRSPLALLICSGMVASTLSHHAWQALDLPLPREVDAHGTLVRDPEWVNGALRAEVRIEGRRYQLWARGQPAKVLRPMLAGQTVAIKGTTASLSGRGAPSQRRKHVAGRVNATTLQFIDGGNYVAQSTNGVRHLLSSGASSLPEDNRSLLMGVLLGDDREQKKQTREDFEAAGLLHLTAVSGANVAFVLLVFAPLLTRFSLNGRLLGAIGVLSFFGALTRWEPSVVRAEAMALMVLIASHLGRPISLWRALALGVTGALLADPFLSGSIGFLLSVTACVGMALFGERITNLLYGPIMLRRAIAYSIGAQIGVAPIQLAVFGPMPLVGLPANVLAGPLAAGIMVWGLPAGLAAGIAGEPLASALHLPTRVLTSTLAWLASAAHQLHFGHWQLGHVVAMALLLGSLAWYRHQRARTTFNGRESAPARVLSQRR